MTQTRRKRRWVKPLVVTLVLGAVAVLVPAILFALMFSMAEFG